ncbi:MAG: Ribosomal silencing factor RsfS [Chlamydiia bacterium]|nr:Ribosomal silencing factor RsfS [Chlamydiia bacterium]MCH9615197.1 Ribosomal silencing factor RsfS [Chlamydiia bacterium]MCH9628481.1 Ribosomal silencing factor RsfS [Chlamydiia bacterium]
MNKEPEDLVNLIAQSILDKKGSNIIAIDIREISSTTNYLIIAEGNVDRHVKAISNDVEKSMKEVGETPLHIEGRGNGDWVVMDYGHIIVHLFMPDMREKYKLERLWSEGTLVELKLNHEVV